MIFAETINVDEDSETLLVCASLKASRGNFKAFSTESCLDKRTTEKRGKRPLFNQISLNKKVIE